MIIDLPEDLTEDQVTLARENVADVLESWKLQESYLRESIVNFLDSQRAQSVIDLSDRLLAVGGRRFVMERVSNALAGHFDLKNLVHSMQSVLVYEGTATSTTSTLQDRAEREVERESAAHVLRAIALALV